MTCDEDSRWRANLKKTSQNHNMQYGFGLRNSLSSAEKEDPR